MYLLDFFASLLERITQQKSILQYWQYNMEINKDREAIEKAKERDLIAPTMIKVVTLMILVGHSMIDHHMPISITMVFDQLHI